MTQKSRAPRITQAEMRRLIMHHLEYINTPRSLAIFMIMKNTDDGKGYDDEIVSLRVDPRWFRNSSEFAGFYEPTELVRKWTGLVISWDPESVAWDNFRAAEEQCRLTNQRLATLDPELDVTVLMERARKNLAWLLGDVRACIPTLLEKGGWGKGVTSSCKGSWLTDYHKILANPESTQSVHQLAEAALNEWSPLFLNGRKCTVVEGSKLNFVPKDAKTHRTIDIQPSVNLFFQRGIGRFIKRRLRGKFGIDLGYQGRNSKLARVGSIDGSVATIDLSSASDTISRGLVEKLLPGEWVALLNAFRSAFTSYQGKRMLLHKWSAMGNGYTFELETAIFAALVKACLSDSEWENGNWAVYGDDIIVPTSRAEQLCRLLDHCGFTLNSKKTFISGPFRESCGADYFEGDLVRPFYAKNVDWITIVEWHNRLVERAEVPTVVEEIRRLLGPTFPRGPYGYPGMCLHDRNFSDCTIIVRHGIVGASFPAFFFEPRTITSHEVDGPAAIVAHLRLLAARSPTSQSEPWILSMTKVGRWVRRRAF